MSHIKAFETQMTDMDVVDFVLTQIMGLKKYDRKTVKSYYAQPIPGGGLSTSVPCDAYYHLPATIDPGNGIGLGIRRNPVTGKLEILCDVYDCDKTLVLKLGEDYDQWELAKAEWTDPETGKTIRSKEDGHLPTGTPNHLLKHYAAVATVAAAANNKMNCHRTELSDGSILLVLTGGDNLQAHEELHVLCLANGETKVAVHGVHGPSCIKDTEWLNEVLGRVVSIDKTADYYHDPEENHVPPIQAAIKTKGSTS